MDAHEHIVQLDRLLVLEFSMEGLIERTFSSPIVNLPCVCWFASAKA